MLSRRLLSRGSAAGPALARSMRTSAVLFSGRKPNPPLVTADTPTYRPEEVAVNNLLYNYTKPRTPPTRHILAALVANQPGVLSRFSGLLSARNFNIESLVVAGTEVPGLSRITVVMKASEREVEQARRQIEDMVEVWAIVDFGDSNKRSDIIERELLLIKVSIKEGKAETTHNDNPMMEAIAVRQERIGTHVKRASLIEMTQLFKGSVVDMSENHLTLCLTGKSSRIDAFLALAKPFGIIEASRSGSMAMRRESSWMAESEVETEVKEDVSAADLPPG